MYFKNNIKYAVLLDLDITTFDYCIIDNIAQTSLKYGGWCHLNDAYFAMFLRVSVPQVTDAIQNAVGLGILEICYRNDTYRRPTVKWWYAIDKAQTPACSIVDI